MARNSGRNGTSSRMDECLARHHVLLEDRPAAGPVRAHAPSRHTLQVAVDHPAQHPRLRVLERAGDGEVEVERQQRAQQERPRLLIDTARPPHSGPPQGPVVDHPQHREHLVRRSSEVPHASEPITMQFHEQQCAGARDGGVRARRPTSLGARKRDPSPGAAPRRRGEPPSWVLRASAPVVGMAVRGDHINRGMMRILDRLEDTPAQVVNPVCATGGSPTRPPGCSVPRATTPRRAACWWQISMARTHGTAMTPAPPTSSTPTSHSGFWCSPRRRGRRHPFPGLHLARGYPQPKG